MYSICRYVSIKIFNKNDFSMTLLGNSIKYDSYHDDDDVGYCKSYKLHRYFESGVSAKLDFQTLFRSACCHCRFILTDNRYLEILSFFCY